MIWDPPIVGFFAALYVLAWGCWPEPGSEAVSEPLDAFSAAFGTD